MQKDATLHAYQLQCGICSTAFKNFILGAELTFAYLSEPFSNSLQMRLTSSSNRLSIPAGVLLSSHGRALTRSSMRATSMGRPILSAGICLDRYGQKWRPKFKSCPLRCPREGPSGGGRLPGGPCGRLPGEHGGRAAQGGGGGGGRGEARRRGDRQDTVQSSPLQDLLRAPQAAHLQGDTTRAPHSIPLLVL